MRTFLVLSAFLASVLGAFCRSTCGSAAAACRVCEFVVVEASDDSVRFDVVSGVAVAASEEYAVRFIVSHYGVVVDVVQGASCD